MAGRWSDYIVIDTGANDIVTNSVVTLEDGYLYQLQYVVVVLVASAVVGNRNLLVSIADGGVDLGFLPAQFQTPASTTTFYNFVPGVNFSSTVESQATVNPCPQLVLRGGATITPAITPPIDAGGDLVRVQVGVTRIVA